MRYIIQAHLGFVKTTKMKYYTLILFTMHNFVTENNHQPLDQTSKLLTTDTSFKNSTS